MSLADLRSDFAQTHSATMKQRNYIRDLSSKRDIDGHVTDSVLYTIDQVRRNNLITGAAASEAISALLRCRPFPTLNTAGSATIKEKSDLLRQLPLSRYALPRKDTGEWNFFEVVQRPNGIRYLNQLLGSPNDWNRKTISVQLQTAAARAILIDPKASAVAYASRHGRCAVCNAHLSDPESIARSMGPVCAKRFN
jgi:hypothetical protein